MDTPLPVRRGRAWLAIVLWFATGLFWIVRIVSGLFYWLFILAFGTALIYSIYYFRAREEACRQCGGRTLLGEDA